MLLCADVLIEALPAHVERNIFTYSVPENLQDHLKIGMEVVVPFGKQTRVGYLLRTYRKPPEHLEKNQIKAITQLTGKQGMDETYLKWLAYISKYYLSSFSQVVTTAIPRRLSTRIRKLVKPQPDAATFWSNLQSRHREASQMTDFGAYLISNTPRWKTLKGAERKYGPQGKKWLRYFEKEGWVTIVEEVASKATEKTQLALYYTRTPEGMSSRQAALLKALQAQGGYSLLQPFLHSENTTSNTLRRLAELGAVRLEEARVLRMPQAQDQGKKALQHLTPLQSEVLAKLLKHLKNPTGEPILLHGVTGSGKTEIYLHALYEVLQQGHTGMFLVPEIGLTSQMLRRCRAVFGDQVAILHSELSTGEFLDEWQRIEKGEAKIVLGARSAVFAPLPDLKLIILDEEHENAYKQDSGLRYDARVIALMRMRLNKGQVVFGSATPRIEAYFYAQEKKWHYLSLPQRVHERPMPPVLLVDMRQEQARENFGALSHPLKRAIEETLAKKEQAILLLNRRGYSNSWLCRDCGEAVGCPLCAVGLTYHRHENVLKCHYCDYRKTPPTQCPACHSNKIQGFGLGTQKLEELLLKLFKGCRTIRMDRDTTTEKNAHSHLLQRFGNGEADILIGTQMVAKGLDFPRVTLVGILAADMALNLPDFRASERTFQLLTQAAGRAGRSDLEGRIVLQTYAPEHPAIQFALQHDYTGFYAEELLERQDLNYPPFGSLARILFAHPQRDKTHAVAKKMIDELVRRADDDLWVLGPVDAPLEQLQSLYRVHALLKHPDIKRIKPLLRTLLYKYGAQLQRITLDIDPYSML
jgi:primosomal protein N' (replication factor Y) (superfamily II helicase)